MGFDYANFFREEEEKLDEYLEQQYQEFFEVIRIHLIIVLLVSALCFIANLIISKYKNADLNSEIPSSREDRLTYWVAIKLCMFGLAIAIGISLLLPLTIISNEVLLRYPEDQYPNLKWLNDKLIQQLWSYIFIFSNFCFILIPFSYFFAESTGFSSSTDNFVARLFQAFFETQLTLTIILSATFLGLSTIFPIFQPNFFQIITFWLDFPFLYSCISFAGAIFLLVCTPKGVLNMVVLLDEYMTRPYLVNTTTEKYDRVAIEETVISSRIQMLKEYNQKYGDSADKMFEIDRIPNKKEILNGEMKASISDSLHAKLLSKDEERQKLYQKLSVSWIRSKIPWLLYPIAMLLLITTTLLVCAIVFVNLLMKMFNFHHTPAEPFVLGIASISKMGVLGALLQMFLIFYIISASFIGLYDLPVFSRLRPIAGSTPFFKIMLNCMVVLILSSALPLFTRTVGITNFDLFGNFGQIVWIQNYHLVIIYNCIFLVTLIVCLSHHIVIKIGKEFLSRFVVIYTTITDWFHRANQELKRFITTWIKIPHISLVRNTHNSSPNRRSFSKIRNHISSQQTKLERSPRK